MLMDYITSQTIFTCVVKLFSVLCKEYYWEKGGKTNSVLFMLSVCRHSRHYFKAVKNLSEWHKNTWLKPVTAHSCFPSATLSFSLSGHEVQVCHTEGDHSAHFLSGQVELVIFLLCFVFFSIYVRFIFRVNEQFKHILSLCYVMWNVF